MAGQARSQPSCARATHAQARSSRSPRRSRHPRSSHSPSRPTARCSRANAASPPRPSQRPSERTFHGDTVTDPYAWLLDAEDPETLPHLEAENAWTEAATAGQEALREALFGEIKDRTLETDLSVPVRDGAWWYLTRTEEGKAYPIHCRRPDDGTTTTWVADPAAEQVVLDASVVIGHLTAGDVHAEAAFRILNADEWVEFAIHPHTLAEVLVAPTRLGVPHVVHDLFEKFGVERWTPDADYPNRIAAIRAETGLKLADCCPLDTAEQLDAKLATFDSALARVARERGIEVLGVD